MDDSLEIKFNIFVKVIVLVEKFIYFSVIDYFINGSESFDLEKRVCDFFLENNCFKYFLDEWNFFVKEGKII